MENPLSPAPSLRAHRGAETEVVMIGHASALIRHGSVAVLTDPWYFGAIFNDSWALLSKPCIDAIDGVTHIWISHEHPDHLHFPTLKMLQQRLRGRCTILVQRSRSGEMVAALRPLGFADVVELPLGEWIGLGDGVEILCLPSRRIDSMLAVKTPSATILDLNDCKLGHCYAEQVARTIGPIDLLLCQFAIANWPGNRDTAPRQAKRYRVARRSKGYADIFRPQRLMMFGSFARFCHEENSYVNAWVLPPAEAEEYLRTQCQCAVSLLYPGDRWSSRSGVAHAGNPGEQYARDWRALRDERPMSSASVTMPDILDAARRLNTALAERFPVLVRRFVEPVLFYVEDHRQSLCFDVAKSSATVIDEGREGCHLALHSHALWHALAHRWGFDTLDISGRFQLVKGPKTPRAFRMSDAYSAGWDLRHGSIFQTAGSALRRWCLKRGELVDVIESRVLGRAEL